MQWLETIDVNAICTLINNIEWYIYQQPYAKNNISPKRKTQWHCALTKTPEYLPHSKLLEELLQGSYKPLEIVRLKKGVPEKRDKNDLQLAIILHFHPLKDIFLT